MKNKLKGLYFDEYKHGKISSNKLCDKIIDALVLEKETKNVDSICDFIVENHVIENLKEKLSKKLEYLKNI